MTRCWGRLSWRLGLIGYLILTETLTIAAAVAQLSPDRTLGHENSVVTPNVMIRGSRGDRIEGGAQRGVNLFHSFQDLNVNELQRVYFANPTGVENILTRVTGSHASNILGTLGVDGAANLFLLNPNGILFGPNARLDIAGSFVASTADRLVFGNGLEFSAVNPQAAPLLTINIRPGLQYGISPGTIANAGHLSAGQDLTLAGGNLLLQGQLQAGRDLTLQATDTVQVRDRITTPFIATAGGQLLIQGDRHVDLYALNHPSSGLFAGGDLVLRSPNPINGDAHYTTGSSFRVEQLDGSPGSWGSVDDPVIRASGDVSFTSYTGGSLHILAGGSVTAGTITINGTAPAASTLRETVTLSNGTALAIDGSTQPTLDIRAGTTAFSSPIGLTGLPSPVGLTLAGTPSSADITVGTIAITQPRGLVYLSNRYRANEALSSPNGIRISTINAASATGGSTVVIDSRSSITGSGRVNTSATTGNGGNVTMLATGNLALSAAAANGQAILASGALGGRITLNSDADLTITGAGNRQAFAINSTSSSTATTVQGGDVTLTARNLTLRNAGTLLAATQGTAQGGNLNLTADTIALDNSEADTAVFPGARGNGGKITVNTRSLTLNNAGILAVTLGLGNSGDVNVNADAVALENFAGTASTFSQIGTVAFPGAVGNAGNLALSARTLSARNGSQLVASTAGRGNAGSVTLRVSESVQFDGAIDTQLADGTVSTQAAGVVSTVEPGAIAQGGNILIQVPSLTLTNGAQIRTSTRGIGNAGNVTIEADELALDGGERNNAQRTGITSAVLSGARGNGGTITIRADAVSLTNQAAITASTATTSSTGSTVSGRGGDVNLAVGSLSLSKGGQIRSNTSGQGDAGNLNIQATDQIELKGRNSGLFATTNPGSTGKGGRITIANPNQLQLDDQASISVDSQGSGVGGDIRIQADSLTLNRQARISAETASNTGGNITLQVPGILLLRRQSQISTTAGTIGAGGDGGNIQINAGFVIASELENSDITANAFLGRGGRVDITTQGIFGIQFRPRLTPFSDITASSEFGVAGVVSITTPNLDPTQGLADLPTNPVDASQLVTQSCASGGSSLATKQGEFIITGRGGLPVDPGDTLSNPSTWQDLRPLPLTVSQRSRSNPAKNSDPEAIVEAQGWITQPDGQVVLIASTANGSLRDFWRQITCPAQRPLEP
ncbi:filamentous hemagglutinin N-terminal domain-containing protein [Pantanalinema sp. GBBB05]|uniref:two-partner secretion domain-containing protein n=1 Tax=Pantanalinema sp. GBBB05 TaxID=2604139 RepID=UPI003D813749